jgi:rod shape-determining protein MreD
VRRAISWTALILTALLLQSVVFARFQLAGAKPELVYLLTVSIAFLDGPASGAVVGFIGGLAQDFLLNQPKGITALTLTLMGYAVGMVRQYVSSPSPLVPVILVGTATAVGVLFNGLVSFLLGQFDFGIGYLIRVSLLAGAYNALLTPLLFPVIRKVVGTSRPSKVFRW